MGPMRTLRIAYINRILFLKGLNSTNFVIKRINKTTFLKFIIIEIFREYNSQLQNKYMNEVRY